MPTLVNYDGAIVANPRRVVRPRTVEELQRILKSVDEFPSPVRAMGSFHSLTPCAASPGTMVDMTGLTQIVQIDSQRLTLTAQAGLQLLEAAAILRRQGLQLVLNIEIGNMTLGSAACCHSKDSMDGSELGQVSSYVTAVKWVSPSGTLEEASDKKTPELLRFIRSSYGLCGIVYEVTIRIKPLEMVAFGYRTVGLEQLTQSQVADVLASNESVVFWTINRTVVIQTRRRAAAPRYAWLAQLRHLGWSRLGAFGGRTISEYTPPSILAPVQDGVFGLVLTGYRLLESIEGFAFHDPDKMIDYSRTPRTARYAFTFWAFPSGDWVRNLNEYVAFSEDHHRRHGFRCNMQLGSYFVRRDQRSLLSYSDDGDVISIDPIHTPGERDKAAWAFFLERFNEWADARHGLPLLNQSPYVTKAQVAAAYGKRWTEFSHWVRGIDPERRMLNPFFDALLLKPADEPTHAV